MKTVLKRILAAIRLFFRRPEWRLLFWVSLIVAFLAAIATDIYVIVTDIINWFR